MNSILTKAVLCKVSISMFNPKRTDSKITNEVLHEKNAKRNAGIWMKNIIDPKALDPITRLASKSRQVHYKFTLPWGNDAWRILSNKIFLDYQKELTDCKKEFKDQVNIFIANWDTFVEQAKVSLNTMFNPLEYPALNTLRNSFDFAIDFCPLPDDGDFRVELAQNDIDEMKENLNERMKKAQEDATRDLWIRLQQPIACIVEKLSDSEAIFRDSLIENVKEIITLIPKINIEDNPLLNSFANECNVLIKDPQLLRDDKQEREKTALKAQELLEKLKGYSIC